MDIDWTAQLVEQLELHWQNQLRPRLDGLSDAEYFWEPVPGCWSIRRRADARTPLAVGAGDFVLDYAMPPHDPEPVTTIAWRIAHLIIVMGTRSASHFGGPPAEYPSWEYADTAAGALGQLDEAHDRWLKGIRGLSAEDLGRPVGPAEGAEYAESPMAELVLHINREVIHHGAEVSLLRDLYLWKENPGGL